ncbi:uncharacterized protein LOC111691917 [Anoplophora glabripennis]|uniref:uncharacterized protein LOC111691917 n=1 Tax=Anoplophora glabripennis TaxID=217634 RepID=UPI000C7780BE|nr:uncharacterized protein LOC111691917 [Anoplophora glabripennis]
MKLILFLVLTILLTIQWVSATEMNNTTMVTKLASNKARFLKILEQKLKSLLGKFIGEENNDSFIGRCFGVARKLKFAMPLIIFALGVIVTVLAFLTIFSLKTLGLLGLLILMNVSGAVTKLAVAFSSKHEKSSSSPQNVHLHVHQTKDGHFELGHTAPGWEDRIGKYGSSSEVLDNTEISNLYRKIYLNNLLLGNYGHMNR